MKFSFYKDSKNRTEIWIISQKELLLNLYQKKISYTWVHPNIPDFQRTVVTWELEKIENNRTKLKLVHIGFKTGKMLKEHDEGWTYFLDELAKYCKARQ